MSTLTDSQTENVRVSVRIRPLNQKESSKRNVIIIEDNSITCRGNRYSKTFRFDHIFDENSTQLEVYRKIANPIVDKSFEGYNGTIFAYGQTGTGKTHTMTGGHNEVSRGIVPNVFVHIFSHISSAPEDVSFVITATYLEIYNEEVRDLLSIQPKTKLEIRERGDIGVYVKNLTGYTVDSIKAISDLLDRGNLNRSTSMTSMNDLSSRSHAIFTVTIESKRNNTTTSGKINLVDLAGSERLNRTQATGDRLKEASNINQSLSALGNVISALVDEKGSHIPYRNSKLTRLLQDSLGGTSKTAMIATVSPCEDDFEETVCTLRYASRVKRIKNYVKANVETKKSLIESFEEEIIRLQKKISLINIKKEKRIKGCARKDGFDDNFRVLEKEKEDMLGKIGSIQKKILIGGENLLEKVQWQLNELEESTKELNGLDETYYELDQQIEEVENEKFYIEERYSDLREENQALDKRIAAIEKLLKESSSEANEKKLEYRKNLDDLRVDYQIRKKEINFADWIIKGYVPERDLKEIEKATVWNEEINDFQLMGISFSGNNMRENSSKRERNQIGKHHQANYLNYNSKKSKNNKDNTRKIN